MNREDEENGHLSADHQESSHKKIEKQGMSDEEIIASGVGLESRDRVPKWFWAIIVVVILIAYGLTVPFWGDRIDNPRPWFTWGHVGALAYILVFGGFVYFMTMMSGGDDGGEAEDQEEFDGLSGQDKTSGHGDDKK
ncbi:MAG: hypothetical protein Q9M21_04505 [Mariprofundaceae bacterium]|nr:hypothetical protein [Mariprofundaceae bacterium]